MDSADQPSPQDLLTAPRYRFRDWRSDGKVPDAVVGVYAVWRDDGEFVYVGMAGRSIASVQRGGRRGLWGRLNSHQGGRLSGDQFCVYIANRFVIPRLQPDQLPLFASGDLRLDTLTRQYIHEHLSYSFVILDSPEAAFRMERAARMGHALGVKPTLNPL